MKLLILTPQLPFPPQKGTTIRNFHLLRNLAARHEVTLLSFFEPETEPGVAQLQRCCAKVALVPQPRRSKTSRLLDLPFPNRPDLVRRLRSERFTARLCELLREQQYDLVQIEGLEMASHWDGARHSMAAESLPVAVLDDHNSEYVLQRRAFEIDRRRPSKWHGAAYSWVQWKKLARYERLFCRSVSAVLAASEYDRQALLSLDGGLRVGVAPNGVDVAHYRQGWREEGPRKPVLIFVGTMDFRPNVDGVQWFCREVWPAVRAAVPEARFWIVGRHPKPEVRALGDGETVIVTGAVDDVRPLLARASVTVVPLRFGGGSRLKVLEAMAAGLPVVSTSLGCEGIAVDEETAVVADGAVALAQATVDLLQSEARQRALAVAARRLVEKEYDWHVIVPRVEAFHRELLSDQRRSVAAEWRD